MRFAQQVYEKQALSSAKPAELPAIINRPKTLDARTHQKLYGLIQPLIRSFRLARWMTIGDGKLASDAWYLLQNGCSSVIATDIFEAPLQKAKDLGLIGDYQVQNAEKIILEDESVDWIMCKEAYHHFPRPPIAFYEFLRVVRQGFVMIEPNRNTGRPLEFIKYAVKKLVRGNQNHDYEPDGNFIYRVSVDEIGKMCQAMNIPCISYRFLNIMDLEPLRECTYSLVSPQTVVQLACELLQDLLTSLRLMNPGVVCVVVFKKSPSENTIRLLRNSKFMIRILPTNPYIEESANT